MTKCRDGKQGVGLSREGNIGGGVTNWRQGLVERGPCDGGRLDFMISGDASEWDFWLCVRVHMCMVWNVSGVGMSVCVCARMHTHGVSVVGAVVG